MIGTRPKAIGEAPDVSHHPTRKVDSMSSLVAEMLLRDPDADVTSQNGLPAVNAAEGVAGRGGFVNASSAAEDSAAIRAFRSRTPRAVVAILVLCVLAAIAATALSLSR